MGHQMRFILAMLERGPMTEAAIADAIPERRRTYVLDAILRLNRLGLVEIDNGMVQLRG